MNQSKTTLTLRALFSCVMWLICSCPAPNTKTAIHSDNLHESNDDMLVKRRLVDPLKRDCNSIRDRRRAFWWWLVSAVCNSCSRTVVSVGADAISYSFSFFQYSLPTL